ARAARGRGRARAPRRRRARTIAREGRGVPRREPEPHRPLRGAGDEGVRRRRRSAHHQEPPARTTGRRPMRVRFAPSPTGYLHVGGARTAIYNWLLARKHGGVFVLRIEDTDRDRSSEEHTRAILDGLSWLGVDWDEGPYFQSEGVERHRAAALRLLEEGKAYRDFADPDDVREEAKARSMHASRVARERADALGPGEA